MSTIVVFNYVQHMLTSQKMFYGFMTLKPNSQNVSKYAIFDYSPN